MQLFHENHWKVLGLVDEILSCISLLPNSGNRESIMCGEGSWTVSESAHISVQFKHAKDIALH